MTKQFACNMLLFCITRFRFESDIYLRQAIQIDQFK